MCNLETDVGNLLKYSVLFPAYMKVVRLMWQLNHLSVLPNRHNYIQKTLNMLCKQCSINTIQKPRMNMLRIEIFQK